MEKAKKTKKYNPHAWFWVIVKNDPEYNKAFEKEIEGGIVRHHSDGKTESLSDLYENYRHLYIRMRKTLMGDKSVATYREQLLKVMRQWSKAKDCDYSDDYLKAIVCRGTGYKDFNKIPVSILRGQKYEYDKQKKGMEAAKKSKELHFVNLN